MHNAQPGTYDPSLFEASLAMGSRLSKQFGVKRFGPLPSKRATFVIDQDRTVVAVISSELNMEAHADQALSALRSH